MGSTTGQPWRTFLMATPGDLVCGLQKARRGFVKNGLGLEPSST